LVANWPSAIKLGDGWGVIPSREKQLKDLQEAYGEAMLELRARTRHERGHPLAF
jgi:hypothetical protein